MRTHTIHKQAPLMQLIQEPNKEPSHTPGPWRKSNLNPWVYGAEGEYVAQVEDKENARLIASAPTMLEALQAIVDALGDQDSLLIEQAKDAIRKATQ